MEKYPTHGGSIRLYIERIADHPYEVSPRIRDLQEEEHRLGMYSDATYAKFAKEAAKIPVRLAATVKKLRAQGKRVIGYGASAKGNVLLNMCGFGPRDLEYIVDSTPYKQGLYTPGSHILIRPEEVLKTDTPDYAVLFIWNFLDEVLKKQKGYLKRGGHFIVPVPSLRII